MTAVIGILNKRGAAIAADSAVTRKRGSLFNPKVTKNGNKMIRLSNAVPVSVMTTGNGNFLRNPWDVIIRRYRQERGHIAHPTVEACAHDLFAYISQNPLLWEKEITDRWITQILDKLFDAIEYKTPDDLDERKDDGSFVKHKTYLKTFRKLLKKEREKRIKHGVCPQFQDYTLESFSSYAKEVIDKWVEEKTDIDSFFSYPIEFINEIREDLELALLTILSTRLELEESLEINDNAVLIFTGFGTDQEYPSLVAVNVCEGIDNKVNYHIRPKDIVCISDENPVAICPFAQIDISNAIIRGQHYKWSDSIYDELMEMEMEKLEFNTISDEDDEYNKAELISMLNEVKFDDLLDKIENDISRQFKKNQHVWEIALKDYDLKAMAALAESMINLTGFQRILTFQQEGVGGLVDVAVITKNDGFSWLSRKSWYHHKDVNGQYGSLGI